MSRPRNVVLDPVASLFDAVADLAAVESMRTGRVPPSTRIVYESDGSRAFNDRHTFRVYVDGHAIVTVAQASLARAAHRSWIYVQHWTNRNRTRFSRPSEPQGESKS